MKYLLSQIAEICGGRLSGVDRTVESVITDSRSLATPRAGLFVAMRGIRHDSHIYIDEMASRGVDSFLVESDGIIPNKNISYVVVPSALNALQRLARYHRQQFRGRVVAITGSNAKTTIKEWIAQVAPRGVKLFRSPRSYNSQLGVALSLLMISDDHDVAIIEAGISRNGEMSRLRDMIRPEVVIFSSIGDAHSQGFDNLSQKIEEKMELCRGAKTLIYHSDYCDIIPYLPNIETLDAKVYGVVEGQELSTQRNFQIVEALCFYMNYPAPRFETLHPVAMRLEQREGINSSIILNDTYNCDINSLRIAVDRLASLASRRATTLILSDILQSGMSSAELYGRVADIVDEFKIDTLIGVGVEIASYRELFRCNKSFYATTQELLDSLTHSDYAGRAILLKGNRQSRFERVCHVLSYKSHTTTLEVDLDAMVDNLNYLRRALHPTTKITAMVKASSYGAGEMEVAQMLQHQGVEYLAVAFADEGQRLRERGIRMPIIVLNADDGSFSQMIDYLLEPEIYSLRSLQAFALEVQRHDQRDYPIHIKLDTGMHRLGFAPDEIEPLRELPQGVRISSIFSHLSSADDKAQDERTKRQVELFNRVCDRIKSWVDYPVMCHICASAAVVRFPEYQGDMCRLGIGLYGYGVGDGLRPVSTLKSRIVQIKNISAGEAVGYGAEAIVSRDSKIATIPIGYADGLDRRLGCGLWSVIVQAHKAPIVGRVCMDSCMVDITDIDGVDEGSEVVIFSPQKGNTAQDMADVLGTIPYEVITSISSRVKRIYLKE